jgi:hypothetical protein
VTEELLQQERRRSEELLTRMKYLQADFENYRKRVEKEMQDAEELSVRNLATKLLGVLDELELAAVPSFIALRIARRMGAAGEEYRVLAQRPFEFFYFLFNLPELRRHEGKTHDCFCPSSFPGDLLCRNGKEDAKIPVQAFSFKAPKNHRKAVPVFPGLP